MKTLLSVLMVVGVAFLTPTDAQHFDIWEWITQPQSPTYDYSRPYTRAKHIANGEKYLPVFVRQAVDDYFPMIAAKIALLSHYPNTNVITNAALASAIPSSDSAQRELRYMAMFKREVQTGYASLPSHIPEWVDAGIRDFLSADHFSIYRYAVGNNAGRWLQACHRRAETIADQMGILESKRMMQLAADVNFVRDAARVKLNELPGFMLTSGQQNITLTVRPGASPQFYAPLFTFNMAHAEHIGVGTAGTATVHVTAKSLPVLITIGSDSAVLLERNGNRSLVATEVARGVKVAVLQVPSVTNHIENQTVARGVVQTVNYGDVFAGERLSYAVQSEQTSVCTVRLTEAGILAITGVSAGNSTVRLTATNASGSAVTSFLVTVPAE